MWCGEWGGRFQSSALLCWGRAGRAWTLQGAHPQSRSGQRNTPFWFDVGRSHRCGQIELDLVLALVKPHGHGADKRLHPRRALVVTGMEIPLKVFIVPTPELQRWNISSGSWWSWPGREAWCPVFSSGQQGMWCRWCSHWIPPPPALLLSVILLMWPFRTFWTHIWSGLLPRLFKMDRKPLWKVFFDLFVEMCLRMKIMIMHFISRPWSCHSLV